MGGGRGRGYLSLSAVLLVFWGIGGYDWYNEKAGARQNRIIRREL